MMMVGKGGMVFGGMGFGGVPYDDDFVLNDLLETHKKVLKSFKNDAIFMYSLFTVLLVSVAVLVIHGESKWWVTSVILYLPIVYDYTRSIWCTHRRMKKDKYSEHLYIGMISSFTPIGRTEKQRRKYKRLQMEIKIYWHDDTNVCIRQYLTSTFSSNRGIMMHKKVVMWEHDGKFEICRGSLSPKSIERLKREVKVYRALAE